MVMIYNNIDATQKKAGNSVIEKESVKAKGGNYVWTK